MEQSLSLEKKILALILSERNHTAEEEILNAISQDPGLSARVADIINCIETLISNPADPGPHNHRLQEIVTPVSDNPDETGRENSDNHAEKQTELESNHVDSQLPATSEVQPDEPVRENIIVEAEAEAEADVTVTSVESPPDSIDTETLNTNNDQKEKNESHEPPSWEPMPYSELDTPPTLAPGQIPTEQQRAQTPAKRLAPPQARVNILNARAGEPYSSQVAISLDNGQQAKIIDVAFSRDIGLSYDREQQSIEGIPGESGDVEITVHWSCDSHEQCETKSLLIVNPDPRSLWKVLEPPSDAPYQKVHLDCAGLISGDIRIAASSRRGRSHEHAGTFRDDDFYINHSDETGWAIMLVADGAGSAINSREGSRIAVQTAGKYLFNQLSGQKGLTLKDHITAWGASDQQATISAMLHHFKQAATLAVNSIQNEAIHAEQAVKSYSTTLLATISLRTGTELFAAAFWLGDGAIAACSPSGRVRILGTPDSGEYAGQTRFLDQSIIEDTSFTGRISVGKWNDVAHLILMTDGVSDPLFETDNGLRSDQKWTRLVDELAPMLADAETAPDRLGDWLNFFSPGNHDDRTIAVLW